MGGHAPAGQTGGDQCPLVQRLADDGAFRRTAGTSRRILPAAGGSRSARVSNASSIRKAVYSTCWTVPTGPTPLSRPNQLFAVSLPESPLDPELQRAVVQLCPAGTAVSYGLRSLSPRHPDFHPQYLGGVWERDGGYHQGPLWGWLLGHYALAEYRVNGDRDAALRLLEPLRDHLFDAALGQISEIFDGAPHTRRAAHRPRRGRWPARWKHGTPCKRR
ncbi:MAG: amylo-alpha-1,6-glucosidase [Candidatus Competibacteraceae bacterium]